MSRYNTWVAAERALIAVTPFCHLPSPLTHQLIRRAYIIAEGHRKDAGATVEAIPAHESAPRDDHAEASTSIGGSGSDGAPPGGTNGSPGGGSNDRGGGGRLRRLESVRVARDREHAAAPRFHRPTTVAEYTEAVGML